MIRVRAIQAFCLGRGVDVFEGTLIDLAEAEAAYKVRQGYVEIVPEGTEPGPDETLVTVPTAGSGLRHFTARDPKAATQDPVGSRRDRRKPRKDK